MSTLSVRNGEPIAKILIIGDSAVGKSSMMLRFADNIYPENPSTTVGIDYKAKRVKIDDVEIKLTLWDTAGQEKYRALATSFYKNAMGIMIVFDLTNMTSFENIKHWLRQVKKNADDGVCKILIGNKVDAAEKRVVTLDKIEELMNETGLKFYEVSAKTGSNVTTSFIHLGRDIKNKYFANLKPEIDLPTKTGFTLKRNKNDGGEDASRCC